MDARPSRPAVMADVAQLAGVSHQTVSRVVNEHPYVKEETRAKVLAAMAKLDYRPNLTARALARRQSDTIGVIAFDTTLHGPASTLFSLEQAARTAGYEVHVVTVPDPEPQAFADAVERLVAQSVCGVVVLAPQRAAVRVMAGLPADLPAVAVEGGAAPGVPSVVVDQLEGARRATRHLVDLGHRQIAHVRGRQDWIEAEARCDGWRRTLEEAGLPVRDPLPGDWSARSGYEAGRALCRDHPEVTGVFVANDHMALGLLRALAEAGVDVPGRVSVVGFDDVAEAEYLHPPLTTVHQDFAEVGRRCVDVLVERIEAAERWFQGRPVVVPARLVVRASTGPVPG
ncbi:LacI family DNA-binding transcriptional regulator [Klenkia taihuensis]|uniref:Transcriptional regulator, LacI family n=1 Tax=Klenkia taihuensis TaxID=1225127 RepID=A0A1I1UR38_9ACTN|nr:LacI family DNA-binding transcriptional regulator [Klenkia taihuensis]GHE13921.1 LacI family transcriptional regulator [Klenkia taihuensis]SFD73164.1 transcriptional regulator, LacI family [Klenkia taihuensis]